MLVQRLGAQNDVNGNPRRIIAFYSEKDGHTVAYVDEGYSGVGHQRIIEELAELHESEEYIELSSLNIMPGEYRRLLSIEKALRSTRS